MDRLARAAVTAPLSNDDIIKITKGGCRILKYDDLARYASLDDVFGAQGAVCILYETEKNYGHWCCLVKHPGGASDRVCFFDPYGAAPDAQLKMIPQYFRKMGPKIQLTDGSVRPARSLPLLTALIRDSPYLCEYNEIDFQSKRPNVNTCGRWCALAILWLKIMSLDKFQNYFLNQKLDPDEYIAFLTLDAGQN